MARPESYSNEEWFYHCLIDRAKADLYQTVHTKGRLLIALETAAWWASTRGRHWVSMSGAELPAVLCHLNWAARATWLLDQASERGIKVPVEIAQTIHEGLEALEQTNG